MILEQYDNYKNTDIPYLNIVPEHWEVKRLKDIAKIKTGKRNTQDSKPNGKYPFFVRSQIVRYINSYGFDGEAILTAGDGVGVGKVFHYYNGKFDYHQRVYNINSFNKYAYGKFLFFFLKENIYKEILKFNVKATVDSLRLPMFQNFKVALPPLSEQKRIAAYLDQKTAAIDNKIALLEKKKKRYKELKKTLINETVCKGLDKNVELKDSDVPWLGQIPVHWEVKRFKDVCFKNHTGGTPPTSNRKSFEGDNIWITIADMKHKYIDKSKLQLSDDAIKQYNIPLTPKGSLLYSFKLSIGKVGFAKNDLYTNEAIISILPNKKIHLRYLYYMLPIFLLPNANENIYGAKLLNQSLIANALLILPPLSEQKAIASYLDKQIAIINNIVGNIETQVSRLVELRKTLINATITGNIKITQK